MFQVNYNNICRADIREKFYYIPSVENIIAVRQKNIIGKLFQDPSSERPPKMMLIAGFNHSRPEQGGCPQYHNKDTLVSNLYHLFNKLHEVHIYTRNETLKDWINQTSDERYRKQQFNVYYNRTKNYQFSLKPGTDGDKVVGIKFG